jgi:hypothetical protein
MMPDKPLKRPRDPAQLAKLLIDIASGEVNDRAPAPSTEGKDAAAVELGRKGGHHMWSAAISAFGCTPAALLA